MADELWKLREFHEEDRNFILATWLRSLRRSPVYTFLPNRVFFKHLEPQLWKLIASGEMAVACAADEPEHILGWACGGAGFLHYAYVKRPYRRLGVAKRMVEALRLTEPVRMTFWVRTSESFGSRLRFKPSLIVWST